jgi:ATP-dependent Clp protease ATP-binding subunit ClpA
MMIVDIQIERMKRYLKDKNVNIILTDKAKAFLAKAVMIRFTARPLKGYSKEIRPRSPLNSLTGPSKKAMSLKLIWKKTNRFQE